MNDDERPRRYYRMNGLSDGPQSIVQTDERFNDIFRRRNGRPKIPEAIHRMAMDEYNLQGHTQTHERMQERGGLSILEVVMLLADAVNRGER